MCFYSVSVICQHFSVIKSHLYENILYMLLNCVLPCHFVTLKYEPVSYHQVCIVFSYNHYVNLEKVLAFKPVLLANTLGIYYVKVVADRDSFVVLWFYDSKALCHIYLIPVFIVGYEYSWFQGSTLLPYMLNSLNSWNCTHTNVYQLRDKEYEEKEGKHKHLVDRTQVFLLVSIYDIF